MDRGTRRIRKQKNLLELRWAKIVMVFHPTPQPHVIWRQLKVHVIQATSDYISLMHFSFLKDNFQEINSLPLHITDYANHKKDKLWCNKKCLKKIFSHGSKLDLETIIGSWVSREIGCQWKYYSNLLNLNIKRVIWSIGFTCTCNSLAFIHELIILNRHQLFLKTIFTVSLDSYIRKYTRIIYFVGPSVIWLKYWWYGEKPYTIIQSNGGVIIY